MDYKPFGSSRINVQYADFTQNYGFTDKELDSESGLMDFGARQYNPLVGRFVSIDPALFKIHDDKQFEEEYSRSVRDHIENPQNLNYYSYTVNNPLKNIDSDGEIVDTIFDAGFVAYDTSNTLYKAGQFIGSLFSGNLQQAADASRSFLNSFVDIGLDAGAAAIPFLPAGLTKVDDAVKLVDKAKDFDATTNVSSITKEVKDLDISKRPIKSQGDIKGYTKHGIEQMKKYNLTTKHIKDAVENTTKFSKRIDALGRESYRYASDKAVVNFNKFKKFITGWPK